LFISQLVVQEAGAGDENAAERRLRAIADIPLLTLSEEAVAFAEKLVQEGPMPQKAVEGFAYRSGDPQRDGLSAHVELQTHRECSNEVQN